MLSDLPSAWRKQADDYRGLALEQLARLAERCADQLERALADAANEEAPIAGAAKRKGWSERGLRDAVARGDVPTVPGSRPVRVRMGDVPEKKTKSTTVASTYDPTTDASHLLTRMHG